MIVLKWLFFIAVGAVAEHFVFPLVNVCGNSMFPTYHDGEIILSRRIFRKNKIKPGDVMVFKHPTVKNRLLIKRVSEVFRDKKGEVQSIYFLGDNAPDSYDSRNFGYVLVEDLVSKIIKPRRKKEDYSL